MALILREHHVRALLSMRDAVGALEGGFNALSQGAIINPPRLRLAFANGVFTILAAAAPLFGIMGLKTYTAFREGTRFVVMLFSAYDGQLLAIIEADWLGCIRTGGVSAVATKYLARSDATAVGVIGAGKQAGAQLLGVCSVRPISSVYVYSRRERERERFCHEMALALGTDVRPVSTARQAVETVDILITATNSPEPVLSGEWLPAGCHINAIGANWVQKRELDLATLQRCGLIFTDSLVQARTEAGDFIIPAQEGLFDWNRVHELSEIFSNTGLVRESPQEITLYKGLGTALEDIIVAAYVYQQAKKMALGDEIALID